MLKTPINLFSLGRYCIELPLQWVRALPLRCRTEGNINNSQIAVRLYLHIHYLFPQYFGYPISFCPLDQTTQEQPLKQFRNFGTRPWEQLKINKQ
jgi:hypothetical protein